MSPLEPVDLATVPAMSIHAIYFHRVLLVPDDLVSPGFHWLISRVGFPLPQTKRQGGEPPCPYLIRNRGLTPVGFRTLCIYTL